MYLHRSLQITNHSFRYASPYLWNQLPSSFRQPHSVHCRPGSTHHYYITGTLSFKWHSARRTLVTLQSQDQERTAKTSKF